MKFSRTRDFIERSVIKGFDGRGNVKSVVLRAAGLVGQNEVQKVTLLNNPTGGTFTLTLGDQTTGAIAYNASAATVDTALEALSNIDAASLTVTGANGGPWTITFGTTEGATDQVLLVGNGSSLTGGGVGDDHPVAVEEIVKGRPVGGPDANGHYIVYEGTILTKDPANPDKVIQFTGAGGEAILGVLGTRVEFYGATSPDNDRAADAFWHNCVFDSSLIIDYATHAAALATALPTCRFE